MIECGRRPFGTQAKLERWALDACNSRCSSATCSASRKLSTELVHRDAVALQLACVLCLALAGFLAINFLFGKSD